MSLRWKLMLILVLVVSGATTAVGILSYRSTQDRMMTEIDDSLRSAANRLLDMNDGNGNRPNRPRGNAVIIIPERPLGIEQYVVQIATTDGVVIGATAGVELPVMAVDVDRNGEPEPTYATLESTDGDNYRVRAELFSVGIVQMGRDLSEVNNVLADVRTRSIFLGAIVALLAAIIGWLIAAGMTSRLRKLSLAAEHVAATGQLDIATSSSGRDETARLARSFAEMLSALSRSKEQQKRLVQDAGHELRTPLTSMRTNLDVLRRHPNMELAMRQQIMLDIDRDAADLAALVEEVVAIAVDRHTDELAQPIKMQDVVQAIADRAARRSHRQITLVGDDSIVVVNQHMFDRAVSNLIDNAIKFDSSESEITVSIAAGSITVSDRGPGIPDIDLPLIFERFHRAAASRSMPGSGLGLSIVADFAEAHEGTVFAHQRAGGGAEIGFSLPLAHQ